MYFWSVAREWVVVLRGFAKVAAAVLEDERCLCVGIVALYLLYALRGGARDAGSFASVAVHCSEPWWLGIVDLM